MIDMLVGCWMTLHYNGSEFNLFCIGRWSILKYLWVFVNLFVYMLTYIGGYAIYTHIGGYKFKYNPYADYDRNYYSH